MGHTSEELDMEWITNEEGIKYRIELVDISEVYPGDYVEHNGQLRTVGRKHVGYDSFMGRHLFGDCYMGGRKKVRKAFIYHARSGE